MTRAELVAGLVYKPGWTIKLAGPNHRYLCVYARCPDSLQPERRRTTQHGFDIPDEVCRDRVTFARWAFDRFLEIERHEAAEFFQFDGQRPFFPAHGDGDPYEHREVWT